MNAWSAVGKVLETGGATALNYMQNESKVNAEQQKIKALENLRRTTNRENADYQNSLKPAGVDPETGMPRSNQWVADNPGSNVVGVEKYKADHRDNRTPLQRNAASAGMSVAEWQKLKTGKNNALSPKDKANIILDVANSDSYKNLVMEADAYNNNDTGSWYEPGVQLRPESERKRIPTPEEYAISMGLLPSQGMVAGEGPNDTQAYTAPEIVPKDVKSAANLIATGKRTKESLVKRFGADNPFTKAVLAQVGNTAVIDPAKVEKEKSKPGRFNSMADAMGKALNFKLNPAEALGKAASATAKSAAKNLPRALKGLSKLAKAAYYGLSESAKAIVAVNDELKKKLSSVTTEEDAKKFMEEVQKVIDADPYDYGTGNVYEPKPL